ncbi:MAG: antitoxin VapB family protein [Candidatus Bathyarchaeia archaeon]
MEIKPVGAVVHVIVVSRILLFIWGRLADLTIISLYIYLYINALVVDMGKVIMVSDELYERLRRMKRSGESFSTLISRLLGRRLKLSDVAGSGTVSSGEWKEVMEAFRNRNELDDVRRKYLLRLIDG